MGRVAGLIGATADGEWALRRLVYRYSEFRGAAFHAQGDLERSRTIRSDTANINAVVDFVAIAESFSVTRLLAIAPNLGDRALNSWKKRYDEWGRVLGSTGLSGFEEWDALLGFVDARNAIQHGLGRLTAMQLEMYKEEVIARLQSAHIRRDGDRLLVRSVDVDRCFGICRDFIAWLDSEAP